MCLIAVANRVIPGIRTLVVANRDEFFRRPTRAAHQWGNTLVGGQDIQAGGGWMLMRPGVGFSAVTNIRRPKYMLPHDGPSRGALVVDGALATDAGAFVHAIERPAYSGFNLLVDDGASLWVTGSETAPRTLHAGIYGLSNATIDVEWPKTRRLCEAVATHGLQREALFRALHDSQRAVDADLPQTGVPQPLERGLSAAFVRLPAYGTRTSTVAWIRDDGRWGFVERTFRPEGEMTEIRLSGARS